jgi:hypothetical protein
MGRMIDADLLREEVYSWGMNIYEPFDFIDAIDDAPTVDVIPKSDYENRLKADMVAMLTEIQLEIEETVKEEELIDKKWAIGLRYSEKIIQQKINSLKEGT